MKQDGQGCSTQYLDNHFKEEDSMMWDKRRSQMDAGDQLNIDIKPTYF